MWIHNKFSFEFPVLVFVGILFDCWVTQQDEVKINCCVKAVNSVKRES